MLKYINVAFFAAVILFSISNSYAMNPDERRDKMRARLQEKHQKKNPKKQNNMTDSDSLADVKKDYIELKLKKIEKTWEIYSKVGDELSEKEKNTSTSILTTTYDNLIQFISIQDVSRLQLTNIQDALAAQNLSLNDTLQLKERLISSLESSLKYTENAFKLINEEAAFYKAPKNDLYSKEIFASDLLPYSNKFRKNIIIRIKPSAEQRPYIISTWIEELKKYDLSDPLQIMKLHVSSFAFADIFLNVSTYLQPEVMAPGYIEHKRLASSLFDGDLELCLSFSELLSPYTKVIQDVLKISGVDEFLTLEKEKIEEPLDRQRVETKRQPAFSRDAVHALEEKYKQKVQHVKAQPQSQPLSLQKNPSQEKPAAASYDHPYDASTGTSSSNLKNEYRQQSIQEKRTERKRKGKEQKKNTSKISWKNKDFEELPSPKPPKQQNEVPSLIVKIGGGPFKIYHKVMDNTFKGSMEKIVLLIEALRGKVDEGRSGSRLKFELPHIGNNRVTYLDMLPPEYDGADEIETVLSQPQTTTTPTTAETVVHTPHKGKSKKLRPYHIKDIRELLISAGYTIDAVQKQ